MVEPEPDFDLALRQVLRTSSGMAPSACPDAETLAASQARALPATEVAAFERHAADCARCRAMLAAFVRADLGTPVTGANEGAVDVVPFWRRWHLNWLVPAAATAAALALYVATPIPSDEGKIAEESTAAQAPDALRSNEVAVPLEKGRAASAAPREETAVETRADARDRRAQAEADTVSDQTAVAASTQTPVEPPSSASASPFAPVPAAPSVTTSAAPASALPPPQGLPAGAAAAEASPPAPSAGAANLADAPFVERPPGALRRTRSANLNEQAVGARGGSGTRIVPLSGSSAGVQFRIDGERLERSGSGDTWSVEPLPAGVSATEITSGTSAGQTIWMVGRSGLVLRAPNGGRFARVSIPVSLDLLTVTAEDARTATVVASDGRRYTTIDGGARWTVR